MSINEIVHINNQKIFIKIFSYSKSDKFITFVIFTAIGNFLFFWILGIIFLCLELRKNQHIIKFSRLKFNVIFP